MFLYEQYAVIFSALLLGSAVGVILASICTAQFFLFLELPFILEVPMGLVYAMIALAIITSFFAVYMPVSSVNNYQISQTIKGLLFN